MVHIRVHGETIGAFPVSELPLPLVESADTPSPGDVSDLVEVVSASRLRRTRQTISVVPVPRPMPPAESASPILAPLSSKPYDYLLKFLLVGDSDVGKQEILSTLENAASDMPFCAGPGNVCHKYHSQLHLMFTLRFSAQSYNPPGGREKSETTTVGHFRPRTVLHNTSLVFERCSGSPIGLRFNEQMVFRRHRSMAQRS